MAKNTAPILLYRNLLRLASKWPNEKDREGRNMREFVTNTIKEEFRKNKNVSSKEEIQRLLIAGKEEYKSLYDMYTNKYIKEYPIRDYPVPEVVAKSTKLLSSNSQRKEKMKTKGMFRSLLELVKSKKPAS